MNRKITTVLFTVFALTLLLVGNVLAQDFTHGTPIDAPETTLNDGGAGNMVAGVDVDGDGKLEIYWINDNWSDGATEVIPRIYKLENDGGTWSTVWSAVAPVAYQDTWPTLALADLDNDGKQELVWGVVNSTGIEANPYRLVVYEHAGGSSDVFGIATADTNVNSGEALLYAPNSVNTLVDEDGANMRIVNWKITDIDADGTDEILFADRKGYYHFGALSVDDIPDNGDGSETWTLEVSSLDVIYNGDNKWDIAVIGNSFYAFDEVVISKITWNGSEWDYVEMMPLPGGISFDAVQTADIDGDEQLEMITGEYSYGDDTRHLWLLQEDADTLKHTALFNINGPDFLDGGRLIGGAQGDIDNDGYLDFIFGSRYTDEVYRLAYRGGAITDSTSYELSMIDSGYAEAGIWNIIEVANMDDDAELEVLYTSSTPAGGLFGGTQPIIVLDYNPTAIGEFDKYPLGFSLNQNYPNPFNPSTTISFNLQSAVNAKMVVYDLLGQKVRTLLDNQMSAGAHVVTWNGLNDFGQPAASGTYFYQLTSDNLSITKKMQLQR